MTTREVHTLVIGSGVAGLFAALHAAEAGPVLVVAKGRLDESATGRAQGGIAAAIGADDSPERHAADTLIAGDGLCDPAAVNVLVAEGPERVRQLIALGARFDTDEGEYALGQEGAHSRRRIMHAGGDATGAEVERALVAAAMQDPRLTLYDHCSVVDLWLENGVCRGAVLLDAQGNPFAVSARAVILASGGSGQLFRFTTNPVLATADGIAVAFRAGAYLADLEFVQFHPTALAAPETPLWLISEAVRGEGAQLFNARGERFMPRYHPLAELAPRDVVSRAIYAEMQATDQPHVWLDTTPIGDHAAKRFPNIAAACRRHGYEFVRSRIPVAPAAHYHMGGVLTDVHARTSLPGLYACGEVSCTGVHGANRLASNSLLEALVYGYRAADAIVRGTDWQGPSLSGARTLRLQPAVPAVLPERAALQALMWRGAALVRSGAGLQAALAELPQLPPGPAAAPPVARAEGANMRLVAELILRAAIAREESRGGHNRSDFPQRNDAEWQRHLVLLPPDAKA